MILCTEEERNSKHRVMEVYLPLMPHWLLLLWKGAAECHALRPLSTNLQNPKGEKNAANPRETMLGGVEIIEFTPSPSNGKGMLTRSPRVESESDSKGDHNPLDSHPIKLVTVPIELMMALGVQGFF